MATSLRNLWQTWFKGSSGDAQPTAAMAASRSAQSLMPAVEIAPDDPLVAYFQNEPSAVELDKLNLDSPALRALREANVKLVAPLVSQGELIGLLNLGPRLSEQEYSSDDRVLLNNLATQASPAVRVAQLVREQQAEVQARERLETELRVARLIQQTLLPKAMPAIQGWHITAYYQPARAVGGDFFDFLNLSDGRLGLVIGDVTDKGVPAALVMATTRATLRMAAQRLNSPGEVLQRVNELICPDIPPKMFITCLYAILDPQTGRLQYANAGHDLPYRRSKNVVGELRARGMPLGLMPGMTYEEKETVLAPAERVLFYSDGLVEAHNPQRDMFSFGRLQSLMASYSDSEPLINFMLDELKKFTGPAWEQEDDVTLMTLERNESSTTPDEAESGQHSEVVRADPNWATLAEFSVASEPGNERIVMQRVAAVVQPLGLPSARLERLKTAVAEATMNAIEHGNHNRPELPVNVEVIASPKAVVVWITDQSGNELRSMPDVPDLEAKLAGLQSPRGWGLFLIKHMVDKLNIIRDTDHHTVELIFYRDGDSDGSATT